jgi:hypothetical protein
MTECFLLLSDKTSPVDSGFYSCAAVSASGSVLSRSELLVVSSATALKHPPIIELGPFNQTLPVGGTATMACEASGQEQTVWLRDGVPVMQGGGRGGTKDGGRIQKGNGDALEITGKESKFLALLSAV